MRVHIYIYVVLQSCTRNYSYIVCRNLGNPFNFQQQQRQFELSWVWHKYFGRTKGVVCAEDTVKVKFESIVGVFLLVLRFLQLLKDPRYSQQQVLQRWETDDSRLQSDSDSHSESEALSRLCVCTGVIILRVRIPCWCKPLKGSARAS